MSLYLISTAKSISEFETVWIWV